MTKIGTVWVGVGCQTYSDLLCPRQSDRGEVQTLLTTKTKVSQDIKIQREEVGRFYSIVK